MQLSRDNLNKPSSKKWKAIADFFLYTLPFYSGAIIALPISETAKLWITFGATVLTVTLKGLSKLTAEDTNTANI
jgi:hypothetical protein